MKSYIKLILLGVALVVTILATVFKFDAPAFLDSLILTNDRLGTLTQDAVPDEDAATDKAAPADPDPAPDPATDESE